MKKIPLTKGKVAIVDDEDYKELSRYKWHYHSCGYAQRHVSGKHIYMHRQIMNPKADEPIDHISMNGLDNQRANLRVCSKSQNQSHTPKRKRNTSGYKGVIFCPKTNKINPWAAQISCKGKFLRIGYFGTKEDAARAYDLKAMELHGEFAFLNFPVTARRDAD